MKVRLRPVGFPWLDSYRDTWECGHGLDIQPRSALLCLQPLEDQIVKCLLQDSLSSLNLSVINDLVTVYVIVSVAVLVKITEATLGILSRKKLMQGIRDIDNLGTAGRGEVRNLEVQRS